MVAWLRGDPESLTGLREVTPLYEPQGIVFLLPAPGERVIADVAVLPAPGSPEDMVYDYSLISASRFVRKRGFRESLFDALSGPSGLFRSLVIGVDPGRECGVSALGDGLLLDATRVECRSTGEYALGVLGDAPHRLYEVYVGDGPGFEDAVESLSSAGIRFRVLEESYTTRSPLPGYSRLAWLKDRDILASIRIAYKGAYGGFKEWG